MIDTAKIDKLVGFVADKHTKGQVFFKMTPKAGRYQYINGTICWELKEDDGWTLRRVEHANGEYIEYAAKDYNTACLLEVSLGFAPIAGYQTDYIMCQKVLSEKFKQTPRPKFDLVAIGTESPADTFKRYGRCPAKVKHG